MRWFSGSLSAGFNIYRRNQVVDVIGFVFVPRIRPTAASRTRGDNGTIRVDDRPRPQTKAENHCLEINAKYLIVDNPLLDKNDIPRGNYMYV